MTWPRGCSTCQHDAGRADGVGCAACGAWFCAACAADACARCGHATEKGRKYPEWLRAEGTIQELLDRHAEGDRLDATQLVAHLSDANIASVGAMLDDTAREEARDAIFDLEAQRRLGLLDHVCWIGNGDGVLRLDDAYRASVARAARHFLHDAKELENGEVVSGLAELVPNTYVVETLAALAIAGPQRVHRVALRALVNLRHHHGEAFVAPAHRIARAAVANPDEARRFRATTLGVELARDSTKLPETVEALDVAWEGRVVAIHAAQVLLRPALEARWERATSELQKLLDADSFHALNNVLALPDDLHARVVGGRDLAAIAMRVLSSESFLGDLNGDRAVERFSALLEQSAELRHATAKRVAEGWCPLAEAYTRAAGDEAGGVVDALLAQLGDRSHHPWERQYQVTTLGGLAAHSSRAREPTFTILCDASESGETRVAAARAVTKLSHTEKEAERMVVLRTDARPVMRAWSVLLTRAALEDDPSPFVRFVAAHRSSLS